MRQDQGILHQSLYPDRPNTVKHDLSGIGFENQHDHI